MHRKVLANITHSSVETTARFTSNDERGDEFMKQHFGSTTLEAVGEKAQAVKAMILAAELTVELFPL